MDRARRPALDPRFEFIDLNQPKEGAAKVDLSEVAEETEEIQTLNRNWVAPSTTTSTVIGASAQRCRWSIATMITSWIPKASGCPSNGHSPSSGMRAYKGDIGSVSAQECLSVQVLR